MQSLWSEARPQSFWGIQAWTPSAEWQFLYLAGHAAYHKWHTLKWLADIHELCISASIDWQKVKQRAERFLDSAVARLLRRVRHSSEHSIPAPPVLPGPFRPAFGSSPIRSLLSEAWKAPLFYPQLLKRPSEKMRWFARNALCRPAWPTAVSGAFLLHSVFSIIFCGRSGWRASDLAILFSRCFAAVGRFHLRRVASAGRPFIEAGSVGRSGYAFTP